jgi:2,3-bisphosphoglycerate-dependent phosphoglycerate mutase
VKHLEHISDADIAELNIPTGIPRRYRLDQALAPVEVGYLGDAEVAAAAAESVARQAG